MNIFLAAFLACVLSHLVVLALLRGWALWKLRTMVKQYAAKGSDQILEDPPGVAALMANVQASRPVPKLAADCEHSEMWHYVLAVSDSPRNPGTILWCRSCGALSGWKPADEASTDAWQRPACA